MWLPCFAHDTAMQRRILLSGTPMQNDLNEFYDGQFHQSGCPGAYRRCVLRFAVLRASIVFLIAVRACRTAG